MPMNSRSRAECRVGLSYPEPIVGSIRFVEVAEAPTPGLSEGAS